MYKAAVRHLTAAEHSVSNTTVLGSALHTSEFCLQIWNLFLENDFPKIKFSEGESGENTDDQNDIKINDVDGNQLGCH